jgi:hypothetical protein
MIERDISDPEHWRDRAARMRGLAIKMLGTQAAILMNDLADDYDRLALSLSVRICSCRSGVSV